MEQKKKRKILVEIAGVSLTLVTDEADSFVENVVSQVNGQMRSILSTAVRTGSATLDAALLCAIDASGEKLKAEKKIRSLEAQLSLYEVNMQNIREELEALQAEQGYTKSAEESGRDSFSRISEALRAGGKTGTAEDKVKTLERYLASKKNAEEENDPEMTREEKIRYIESLLRR